MSTKKKEQPQSIPEVELFVAWVNTLISDGYNLYRLTKIYERDHDKILKDSEVKRKLEVFEDIKL